MACHCNRNRDRLGTVWLSEYFGGDAVGGYIPAVSGSRAHDRRGRDDSQAQSAEGKEEKTVMISGVYI